MSLVTGNSLMDYKLTEFYLGLYECAEFNSCWQFFIQTADRLGFNYVAYCYHIDQNYPAGFFYIVLARDAENGAELSSQYRFRKVWCKEDTTSLRPQVSGADEFGESFSVLSGRDDFSDSDIQSNETL